MKHDLLAALRRTPHQPQIPTDASIVGNEESSQKSGDYVAFEAKDRAERLIIHRVKDPARSPYYQGLLDITYDDSYWENFVLMYGFVIVMVRGKNLRPLIAALQMHTAKEIWEFDPRKWKRPTDPQATIIESIEIQQAGSERAFVEDEKSKAVRH